MGDFISISKKEYTLLLQQAEKLYRLQCGGVDNWEWYGESLYPEGEIGFDEVCEKIEKRINDMTGVD